MYIEETDYIYKMSKVAAIKKDLEDEIAKKKIIVDSLNDTIIKYLHSICLPLNSKMLHAAWCQQREKKKSDRPMYEAVKNEILDSFFKGNKEAELIEILPVGYEEYAYNFIVKFKDINFEINYPCTNHINKQNLLYAGYGTYDLYIEENKNCWRFITSSYDKDEIAETIEEICK